MAGIKIYITEEQRREARRKNMKRYRDKLKKNRYKQVPDLKISKEQKTRLYSDRKLGVRQKIRKYFNDKVIPEIQTRRTD